MLTALPAETQLLAGIAAALLSFCAGVIYVIDILRGRARPHRVTWWVLGVLNCVIAASYYSSGALTTVWLPLEFGISFLVIGLLSIRYGDGEWRTIDSSCLIGGLVGVVAWWFTRSAPFALALFTAVDFVGLAPTIVKAYRRPWTEKSAAWIVGTAAAFLNVLAIDNLAPEISLYPVYVFVTSALVAYLAMGSRSAAIRAAPEPL